MVPFAALVTVAAAATPGGFRSGPDLPVRSVEVRQGFALDSAWVSQTHVAARTNLGQRGSIRIDLPLVLAGGSSVRAGIGAIRGGLYAHFGRRADTVFTLGTEATAPLAPVRWRTSSFATAGRDTLPGAEVSGVLAVTAIPQAPTGVRTTIGFRNGPYENPNNRYSDTFFSFGFEAWRAQPIAGRTSLVMEGSILLFDPIPASGRLLGRLDFADLTLDFGAQLGVGFQTGSPTASLLVAVRHFD